jgi:menaquinol-cytochrome c reductase iron-sulfur subunit
LEPHSGGDNQELPRPTLWPVGFAIGIATVLIGLVVSWAAVGVGGAIAVVFGFLWVRDLAVRRAAPAPPPEAASGAPAEAHAYSRSMFLEASTLGLGAVIGGVVSLPAVGLAIIPPFLKQGHKDLDLGPISDYPQGKWQIVHFFLDKAEGEVTRRVAYIRYNGLLGTEPSFTIISNRCAHLGCPVQPLGLVQQTSKDATGTSDVTLQEVKALSGFGCPCHGGAYDAEGNRTAGPPVRGLDRYRFSIRKGRLYLGGAFSVKSVDGTGANAKIHQTVLTGPGQHVDDWEDWLYPIQPPH